jgi:hypothetical protein
MLKLSREMGRSDGNGARGILKLNLHIVGEENAMCWLLGGLSHAVVCFSYLSSVWDTLWAPWGRELFG